MDVNYNLETQIKLAVRIQKTTEAGMRPTMADSYTLAEMVISMNQWLCQGGDLPANWKPKEEQNNDEPRGDSPVVGQDGQEGSGREA